MTASSQRSLPIEVSATTSLVDMHTARAALGIDEDSVLALIESGDLRWAWDISIRRGVIREVRIWTRCIAARQCGLPQPADSITEVLPLVLGPVARDRFRAAEVRALFCCAQQTIQRLVEAGILSGDIHGRTLWVSRSSLESFLTHRRIA